jgi:uncharacterized protein
MEFTNSQIDTSELPAIQTLDLLPIDGRYKKIMLINTLPSLFFPIGWIAATFIFGFWDSPWFATAILAATLLVPALNVLLLKPSFMVKRFAVREKDVLYQTGLIFRSLTVIPFKRVQHCEISRGPLSRILGLSELHIFTAGGSASDLSIPGLDEQTAGQLSQLILTKIKDGDEEE